MATGRIPINGTAAIQSTIVDAKGDIIAATGADAVSRLAVGADGTTLVADSSEATGLKWQAPAGGGKVLQVVEGTVATEAVNSTDTYADTNLTANITPSAASSKILIMTSQVGGKSEANANSALYLQLLRDSTQISELIGMGYTNNTTRQFSEAGFVKLDSPNTTSQITYKVQFKNGHNGAAAIVQFTNSRSVIVLMEIGA